MLTNNNVWTYDKTGELWCTIFGDAEIPDDMKEEFMNWITFQNYKPELLYPDEDEDEKKYRIDYNTRVEESNKWIQKHSVEEAIKFNEEIKDEKKLIIIHGNLIPEPKNQLEKRKEHAKRVLKYLSIYKINDLIKSAEEIIKGNVHNFKHIWFTQSRYKYEYLRGDFIYCHDSVDPRKNSTEAFALAMPNFITKDPRFPENMPMVCPIHMSVIASVPQLKVIDAQCGGSITQMITNSRKFVNWTEYEFNIVYFIIRFIYTRKFTSPWQDRKKDKINETITNLYKEKISTNTESVKEFYTNSDDRIEKDTKLIENFIKKYHRIPDFGSAWNKMDDEYFLRTKETNRELYEERVRHRLMPDRMNVLAKRVFYKYMADMIEEPGVLIDLWLAINSSMNFKELDIQVTTEVTTRFNIDNLFDIWSLALRVNHPRLKQYCEIYVKNKIENVDEKIIKDIVDKITKLYPDTEKNIPMDCYGEHLKQKK